MADLQVRLTPRGGRDAVTGVADGVVQARVAAPPADGQANASLCRLLAKRLGVAGGRVAIVRGHTARIKTVRVEGVEAHDALARLGTGG